MKRFAICLSLVCLSAPVSAQQRQPSLAEQLAATSGKLQDEVNQDMQVRQVLEQAKSMIADLQKQIEDLKHPKDEPAAKKDDKP